MWLQVPNTENNELYEKYRVLAENEEGVCFVGRLASYKYFNMDQAPAITITTTTTTTMTVTVTVTITITKP